MTSKVNEIVKTIINNQDSIIPAIKEYRKLVGCGLKQAKAAVEAIRDGLEGAPPLSNERPKRVIDH